MTRPNRPHGVQRLSLPFFTSGIGELVIGEAPREIGFKVCRAFLVYDVPPQGVRGGHAHRSCSQLLICASGQIEVFVEDGENSATYLLDTLREGLLISPLVWSQQVYRQAGSVLLVLADEPYDEREYIRSRTEFLRHIRPLAEETGSTQ